MPVAGAIHCIRSGQYASTMVSRYSVVPVAASRPRGPAPIYKLPTLLWLHGHGGADFEVHDDVSPTGRLGGLAMTGQVRNWVWLVKGKT